MPFGNVFKASEMHIRPLGFFFSSCTYSAFLYLPYIRKPANKRIPSADRIAMRRVRLRMDIFWGIGAEFAHICWNAV